jgi:AraC-like DNA-binding protein
MEGRTAPTALRAPDRLAFATHDPGEAHAQARRVMAEHRMTVLDRSAPFRAEVHHVRLGGVGLLHFAYGAAVRIASAPLRDFATIHLPLGGGLRVDHGGARVSAGAGRGVVFSPDGDVAMDWTTGLRLLVVRIERETLESRLRALLGRPLDAPLRFAAALDPRAAGRSVLGVLATAQGTLAAAGPLGPPPLVAAELERSIVTALLLGQPHSHTDALHAPPALASPRVVEAALERAAATPGHPPTVAELAAAAGVGERTLHEAFRRRFGTSPAAHLRDLRLAAVREALLDADPGSGVTVARLALEQGFAHPGRFAAAYRARFGEGPGVTLRRVV